MSFTNDMRKQFEHDLNELRKMRDEVRVKLHLAGMNARDQWGKLEPKLEDLERRIEAGSEEIVGSTSKLFEEVGRAFREFGERVVNKATDATRGQGQGQADGDKSGDDTAGA